MSTEIHGRVHEKFSRVRAAFAKEFDDGNELGASLCLTLEGETVLDWRYSRCFGNSSILCA